MTKISAAVWAEEVWAVVVCIMVVAVERERQEKLLHIAERSVGLVVPDMMKSCPNRNAR